MTDEENVVGERRILYLPRQGVEERGNIYTSVRKVGESIKYQVNNFLRKERHNGDRRSVKLC